MPTRNVVLTDQQAELVEKMVESGRYQNASEVLRDGLRFLQRREREETAVSADHQPRLSAAGLNQGFSRSLTSATP